MKGYAMTSIRMTRTNPPTSIAAINAFEAHIGVKLPPTYRSFLIDQNGGRPLNSTFSINGMHQNPLGSFHEIYGLGAISGGSDATEIFDFFKGGIPKGVVPIGRTDGSDYICLDLRQDRQSVVFWDNSHYWSTGEWREQDLYRIAASFEALLTSLRPNPD